MEGTPTTGAAPPQEGVPTAASGGGGLAESRTWLGDQGLVRPRQGRMLAGVCAGLARRYGAPPFLVRVLMVAAALSGFGLFAYLLLWALMPQGAPSS